MSPVVHTTDEGLRISYIGDGHIGSEVHSDDWQWTCPKCRTCGNITPRMWARPFFTWHPRCHVEGEAS